MATTQFKDWECLVSYVRQNARISQIKLRNMRRAENVSHAKKVHVPDFNKIRQMTIRERKNLIWEVKHSDAFKHVKRGEYSPEEYCLVSEMQYAETLNRVA